MIHTRICDMIGIRYPIIEGGMGLNQGAKGAAAISNAGALGCVGRSPFYLAFLGKKDESIQRYTRFFEEMVKLTHNPFCANIPVGAEQLDRDELLDCVLKLKTTNEKINKQFVALVTSGGNAAPFVKRIKSTGLKHIHKVSTIRQAQKMESEGVDALIALGYEGGGHIGFEKVSTFVMLPMIVESVKIPVIGAGGVCDGKSLAAALALGAEGVEVGTRFLATPEMMVNPAYKKAILEAQAKDAVPSIGRFGDIRYIKNKYIEHRQEESGGKTEEELPEEKRKQMLEEHCRAYEELVEGENININEVPLAAGQNVGRIKKIQTCKEIVEEMVSGAENIINNLSGKIKK
jgi:NAD(P)H-dependent flavin oxidoreductase YrpB (nitropropane dioxygenase family)